MKKITSRNAATAFIAILLFVISPILSLPVNTIFYIFDKSKKRILYSILIGISLGIISYYFIPKVGYDLIKHQNIVLALKGMTFGEVISVSGKLDLEIIPVIYSYFVSFLSNIDLLQFFVVSAGYGILLYLLSDYRSRVDLDPLTFLIVTLFVIFGFHTLYFISGLYCYIAFILFSLVFYCETILNKSKVVANMLYILLVFMHNSLALPVLILFAIKLFKGRFNLRTMTICLLIFIFAYYIIVFANSILDSPTLHRVLSMYNAYTLKNEHYKIYYSGYVFIIEISKLIVTLYFTIKNSVSNKKQLTHNYILALSFISVLMMTKARLAIRYIMIIQFIGIVPIMNELAKNKKEKIIYLMILIGLTVFYILFFISIFKNQSFGNLFTDRFYDSIFTIFNK